MKIIIEPYNALWPELFQSAKAILDNALKGTGAMVEHVGSTSVKGLGAKPIIDIMIGLPKFELVHSLKPDLEAAGYRHYPDFDHIMPYRRLYVKERAGKRIQHVHIVEWGSLFWKRHLRFRNHLRAHQEDRHAYYAMKLDLAERDWERGSDYAGAKTKFIRAMELKAGLVPSYREGREADISQIQLVRNSVIENILSDPALVSDEDVRRCMMETGKCWVAELEEMIVGFSMVNLEERNVWALFLHPDAEGRGIGKELHRLMMEWYFSQTKEKIWLGTDPKTRAEEFYRRQGWKEAGIRENGELKFEMTWEEWKDKSSRE